MASLSVPHRRCLAHLVLVLLTLTRLPVILWSGDLTARAMASEAHSGWVWQNPLPQGNDLFSISCASATTCFAVGLSGTILATTNSGKTWKAQSSGTMSHLYGIDCPNIATCIAVGNTNNSHLTSLTTNNGGRTWQPRSTDTAGWPSSVSCPTVTICFAAGRIMIVTATGGASWTAQTSGLANYLRGISCPTTTTCFAVGDNGTILATTNGGSAWLPFASHLAACRR
jgi:photosystem II stability/assembly factor-like uncharacterized protein